MFYIKDHTEGMPHSHALVQSPSEATAFTAMRHIPEDLVDTAKTLREAGSLVKDVFSWLKLMTVKRGQEPLFNYMDVYHAVGPSTQERTLDATDFVAALHEREKTLGLPYFTKEDRDGCLSAAFWLLAEAREIYSQDPEHMQVLYDTKARAHSPQPLIFGRWATRRSARLDGEEIISRGGAERQGSHPRRRGGKRARAKAQ